MLKYPLGKVDHDISKEKRLTKASVWYGIFACLCLRSHPTWMVYATLRQI